MLARTNSRGVSMLIQVNEQYRVNGLHSKKCQRMGDVFSCEIKERLDSIGGEPAGCPCERPKKEN